MKNYRNNESSTVAKILQSKCPNIYKMIVMLEEHVDKHERIEITYWTETFLHISIHDPRYIEQGSIPSMRMGFSVDFENDIVFYSHPYVGGYGFWSRSHKWNRILKQNNISFLHYCITTLKQWQKTFPLCSSR
jgi:hypothetical protein